MFVKGKLKLSISIEPATYQSDSIGVFFTTRTKCLFLSKFPNKETRSEKCKYFD